MHHYYDGARRIQDEITDPVSSYSPFSTEDESDTYIPPTWLSRDYVYHAASTGALIDDHLCQFDSFNRIAYHVNDHTGTPIALVDDDGAILERYT